MESSCCNENSTFDCGSSLSVSCDCNVGSIKRHSTGPRHSTPIKGDKLFDNSWTNSENEKLKPIVRGISPNNYQNADFEYEHDNVVLLIQQLESVKHHLQRDQELLMSTSVVMSEMHRSTQDLKRQLNINQEGLNRMTKGLSIASSKLKSLSIKEEEIWQLLKQNRNNMLS